MAAMIATGLVVLLAAAVQYASGFGFALITTPLLSLTIGAHDAVLVAVALGLLGNVSMAWSGRRVADRHVLAGVLWWAPPGLAIGVLLYTAVGDQTLQLIVAGAVTMAVVSLASGWRIRAASRASVAVAGVLAGALTTTTGTNGPPVVTLLAARETSPATFRATSAASFLLLDLVAVPLLLLGSSRSAGESDLGWWLVVVCVPALVVGAWLGTRSRDLLSEAAFRRLVLVLLSCSAASAAAAVVVG